jgi:hypothetical protein
MEHEYSLRAELDLSWAVRPLALSQFNGQTMLVLENPGGEPLDSTRAFWPEPPVRTADTERATDALSGTEFPQPRLRIAAIGFAQGVAGGFENDRAPAFKALREAVPTRRAYSNSMPNSAEDSMPDNSESDNPGIRKVTFYIEQNQGARWLWHTPISRSGNGRRGITSAQHPGGRSILVDLAILCREPSRTFI